MYLTSSTCRRLRSSISPFEACIIFVWLHSANCQNLLRIDLSTLWDILELISHSGWAHVMMSMFHHSLTHSLYRLQNKHLKDSVTSLLISDNLFIKLVIIYFKYKILNCLSNFFKCLIHKYNCLHLKIISIIWINFFFELFLKINMDNLKAK